MNEYGRLRVAVVGGSMGGLTAALVLRELGCQVDVYERSPELLDGRGAGVVLQPDTVRWFEEHGGIAAVEKVSTGSSTLRYLDRATRSFMTSPAHGGSPRGRLPTGLSSTISGPSGTTWVSMWQGSTRTPTR